MSFLRKYSLFVPFVLGVLFPVSISLIYIARAADIRLKLDIINSLAQLLIAAASVLAFGNYYENKQDKQKKKALELITYFREKIIPKQNAVLHCAQDIKGKNFNLPRLVSFNINNVKESFSPQTITEWSEIQKIDGIQDLATELLNTLEEFALTVDCYDLKSDLVLLPIRSAFVEIVEKNIYTVYLQQTYGTGPSVYNSLLKLYDEWQSKVDRRTPEERLASLLCLGES